MRRFLLHVLPAGLRILHYGVLSNRHRHEDLVLCRELLGDSNAAEPEAAEEVKVPAGPESITSTRVCPACGAGRMVVIAEFPPTTSGGLMVVGVAECAAVDSS